MPIDLGGPIYDQFTRTLDQAKKAEKQGAKDKAAAAYRQCAELYRQYAASSSDSVIRHKRLDRAESYARKAQSLDTLTPTRPESKPALLSVAAAKEVAPAAMDDYESEVLGLLQHSSIRWEDIGGLVETKKVIKAAYGVALMRKPKNVKIPEWRAMLLYGPPGTGKTLLAAATAGSLEASFFNVKVSNVVSKYFGESSKLITALYSVAHKNSPAVIYLEDFESLVPSRGSGDSGPERRMVSTLLAELDGIATKDEDAFVLTMGATNFPWLLDDAILSRFQKRIYVPLPDDDARRSILEIHLTRRGHKIEPSMDDLVARTKGFSGREIEQLCLTAINHMVQRCNLDLQDLVDQGAAAFDERETKIGPLSAADFNTAFEQNQPLTNPEMLAHYDHWLKQVEE